MSNLDQNTQTAIWINAQGKKAYKVVWIHVHKKSILWAIGDLLLPVATSELGQQACGEISISLLPSPYNNRVKFELVTSAK